MTMTSANSLIEPPIGDSDGVQKNISSDANHDVTNHDATNQGDKPPRAGKQSRPNNQPRRDKRDVHGWVVLDKPIGMTSTHAVPILNPLFHPTPAPHPPPLDPP